MDRRILTVVMGLIAWAVVFSELARAETPRPQAGKVASRDASSTNIPTTYTTGAGIMTSVSGKSHLKVINNTGTALAVSTSTVTNCVGGTDNDVVPANGSSVSDAILLNSVVCVRSLGSAISTGTVYVVVW